MSKEPTFPADAMSTGGATSEGDAAARMKPDNDVTPETAPPAVSGGEAGPAGEAIAAAGAMKSSIWPKAAGVAIGVGSAAIAAALLYRSRKP